MKFTVYAETQYVGSRDELEIEIDDEDLEGLEPGTYAYDKVIEDEARNALCKLIDWGWYPSEE